MKDFLFILLGLTFIFTSAQYRENDSISGGSLYIKGSPKIDSLVQKTIEITCKNANTESLIKDPCAEHPKVMGYKIQIMYSKNRSSARKAMEKFTAVFPDFTPEMNYNAPDYKVLVGDYFTKKSAAFDLARIKKEFPTSFLVAWRIWCRKAKY